MRQTRGGLPAWGLVVGPKPLVVKSLECYKILLEDLKGKEHLGDLNLDGCILLKWTL